MAKADQGSEDGPQAKKAKLDATETTTLVKKVGAALHLAALFFPWGKGHGLRLPPRRHRFLEEMIGHCLSEECPPFPRGVPLLGLHPESVTELSPLCLEQGHLAPE